MSKAERTRQFIIETAAPIFNEKGIAGTSIDDILKATKVAKGCLYGHFENKEALSHAMVDFLLQKINSNAAAKMEKEATAKGKLFAFIDIYKNPLNPLISGGCPILNMGVEADDTNDIINKKVKAAIQKTFKTFSAIINKGISDKEFRSDFNAAEFVLKMFTMLEGGMMVCRVMNNNKYMDTLINILKQEIAAQEL